MDSCGSCSCLRLLGILLLCLPLFCSARSLHVNTSNVEEVGVWGFFTVCRGGCFGFFWPKVILKLSIPGMILKSSFWFVFLLAILKSKRHCLVFYLTNDWVKILFRNVCPWCTYMNVFAECISSHCFRWIVGTSQWTSIFKRLFVCEYYT